MEILELERYAWVAFDIETTGLDPWRGDRICEIAAVKFKEGRKIAQLHTLVNPERSIPAGAYRVHRITEWMVQGAPTISTILPQFLSFVEGSILVAYNAGFDLGFIEQEIRRQGRDCPSFQVVDVLELARRLLPEMERFSLERVAESLGIPFPRQHRALEDADVTAQVFIHFLTLLKNKDSGSSESAGDFYIQEYAIR
jgi:DNA polymerase-3 subunit alpha (Gram-positive type)